MSRKKLWRICHKYIPDNQCLTLIMVTELRKRHFSPKQVAWDLGLSTERIRNWYYKNTGMTAHDLFLLIVHYGFIRQILFEWACFLWRRAYKA